MFRYPDPPLTDGRITLRPWTHDDLPCVEAASSDPRIPVGTTVPAVYTPEAGAAWIDRQLGRLDDGRAVSLAITEAGEAIGLLYLSARPQEGVAAVGYWLVPAARGRRIGSAAVDLGTTWMLAELGFARVEAWVEPDNLASARTLEAAGYEREGLLRSFLVFDGRRTDMLVFSRLAG